MKSTGKEPGLLEDNEIKSFKSTGAMPTTHSTANKTDSNRSSAPAI